MHQYMEPAIFNGQDCCLFLLGTGLDTSMKPKESP